VQNERAAAFVARNFRWNFTILLVEACAFFAGLAFFDGSTVLPVLLSKLHASDAVIGFTRLMQSVGYSLPALFAAHWIHGRTHHKGYLLLTAGISRAGLIFAPIVLLAWGASRPQFALVGLLAFTSLFWLMDGACAVSWLDIVAKAIPPRARGRLFGTMQTLMGLLAILCGALVAKVLQSPSLPFPRNFALLAALWCACAWLSELALAFLREPTGEVAHDDEKPPFIAYVRRAGPMLRRYPRVARLVLFRLLLDGSGMAGPFYVLYARHDLHVSLRMVGIFVMVQNMGRLATGPLWGWIADRHSPVTGLRIMTAAIVLMPLAALAASVAGPWMLAAVFFLMGGTQDGLWMLTSNLLLESTSPAERPFAVGVSSLLLAPTALYGLAGGILAQYTSYPGVFTWSLAFAVAGAVAMLGISGATPAGEPDARRDPSQEPPGAPT